MIKYKIISAAAILIVMAGLTTLAAEPPAKGKVIEFGWDTPTIPWLCQNAVKVECNAPFHGMVLDLALRPGQAGLSRHIWVSDAISSDYRIKARADLESLKQTKFSRLRQNSFFRLNTSGWTPPADWFDPEFETVIINTAYIADAVNTTSLAGIAFDPEDYHYNCWKYPDQKYAATKTFEQYKTQVRQRGREIAAVIKTACPDREFTMLFMFANSQPYISMRWLGHPLSQDGYGLLPAFIDGLLDEADGKIKIIDGIESAYPNKTREVFQISITNYQAGAQLSDDPNRYLEKVGIGFGSWMDYRPNAIGWHTDPNEFNLNHFTPEVFNQAVDAATDLAEYLWIYTEKPDWYLQTVPQEYLNAVSDVTGLGRPAPTADLTSDCAVNQTDLKILTEQ